MAKFEQITTAQGDDYTADCQLDVSYLQEHYEVIAIDLSKQQALDGDSKTMQQLILMEI